MPCQDQIHKHLPGARIFAIRHQFLKHERSRVVRVVVAYFDTIDNIDGIGATHKSF